MFTCWVKIYKYKYKVHYLCHTFKILAIINLIRETHVWLKYKHIFGLLVKDFIEISEVIGIDNDHNEIVVNVDPDQGLDHRLENANKINPWIILEQNRK